MRDGGYQCACANFGGCVTGASALFELPRLFVEDWDGEEFERHLDAAYEHPA